MKQIEQDAKLKVIEDKADDLLAQADFFTVAGFSNIYGVKVDIVMAAKLGKLASALSKDLGIMVGKSKHVNYGQVNTYHKEVLQVVFDKVYKSA